MSKRIEFNLVVKRAKERNITFSFQKLLLNVRNFYNYCIITQEDIYEVNDVDRRHLIFARSKFNSCLNLLMGAMQPEQNIYIQYYEDKNQVYSKFLESLSIVNGRLDKIMKDMFSLSSKTLDLSAIESFRIILMNHMENLILSPLKEAIIKFDTLEESFLVDRQIQKDDDYFFFRLFFEIFYPALLEGNQYREQTKEGKSIGGLPASEFKN